MASIYRRGKIWWIHYLVGGKSVARFLKTANERVALEEKKRLEALEVTDRLARPSSTSIEPFLQSFCEFLLATQTRKSAKNDLSYLRLFFGPCCEALNTTTLQRLKRTQAAGRWHLSGTRFLEGETAWMPTRF